LDVLSEEPPKRRVLKRGIAYEGRWYWHEKLVAHLGQTLIVRAASHDANADTIQVFKDSQWICTAFATDSPPLDAP
jgi:hypothetical protein